MAESVVVILPVKDEVELLKGCLPTLLAQTLPSSPTSSPAPAFTVLVVVDGADPATCEYVSSTGAELLARETNVGPYAARNRGWQSRSESIVVFTDVRCRAEEGWLAAMVEAVSAPGVVIAGCDIQFYAEGNQPAEVWAVHSQQLGIDKYIDHSFLPYVPTACLAIRRTDLEALGGFVEGRSGSDADLCWRAQLRGMGTIGVGATTMRAVARASTSSVLSQWRRYGRSSWDLEISYGLNGNPPRVPGLKGSIQRSLRVLRNKDMAWPVRLFNARRVFTREQGVREQRKASAGKPLVFPEGAELVAARSAAGGGGETSSSSGASTISPSATSPSAPSPASSSAPAPSSSGDRTV